MSSISVKRKRLSAIVCLGILLWIMACIVGPSYPNSQAPARSLSVIIEKSQQDQLFEQFQKFSEKHGFKFSTRGSGLSDELVIIYMARQDILIGASNPFEPEVFRVNLRRIYPEYPVDDATFDALLIDMKRFLEEIPNITITEE